MTKSSTRPRLLLALRPPKSIFCISTTGITASTIVCQVDRRESPLAVIRPSPVPDPVGSEPSRESLVPEVDEPAQTKKKGTKIPAPDDEPPQKKKKNDRKKKPAEKDPVPSVGAENRELVVHEESSRGNAALTDGGSSSFPIVPLERGRKEPSLDRGSDGRDHSKTMNYVVELYDTAFKLKNAEMLVRVKDSALNRKTSEFKAVIEKAEAEQSRLLAGKKAQKAKFTEKEEGPEGEVHGEVWRAEGQIQDCWREDQTERSAVPLIEGSTAPPVLPSSDPGSAPLGASSMVDEEAPARKVGTGDADPVLPAEGRETRPGLDDLVELSDSSIERSGQNESSDGAPPEFLNEDVLAAIDPYESNAGLIDGGTAVILQTPSSLHGEPSTERLAVLLVEGSTVPPVLPSSDPGLAPLGASSIVDEEAPAREVGPGDADPVLPAEGRETRPGLDDLVELSDSSIERSGQYESSDRAPPGVGEDLNASSVERGERGSEDAIAQVPEEPESRSLEADPPISDAGVVENALDPVPRLSVDDPSHVKG
ncbi:hypothetical protein F2Q70_00017731 [Brassica cretica]|uniref:Uncharacterized protein n=1 Tax=Brassica cretica TaxID=69181 RepID=A0A8S9I1V4_BRACR|nr:hypothetical protein F2Q70_00017731 [Brassica cretica]